MESSEKMVYDILVKAEWLENVKATESSEQKGVLERELIFRTGATLAENGKWKLWMFSKLFRELTKGGLSSAADVRALVDMGAAFGKIQGWEQR